MEAGRGGTSYLDKMTYQFIISGVADGVLTITLNRPDVLNSFTRAMAGEVQAALLEATVNPEIRAVLLTGAGRGFCAGQDLSEVLPEGDGPMPDISEIVRESYNPIIRAIRTIEKPVLCAVNGVAAGAGANLAFACDLTIAAEEAVFVESFAKLGLIPDTSGTFFVPRLVGMQRATGMFFLGGKMSAQQAKEWGLIWDVAPLADLAEVSGALARSLATQATRGFGLTKRALNASFTNSLDAQLEVEADCMQQAGRTDDYAEGVRAFLAKRKPVYRGS
jgi:2-(1,2-epoxy-1,2-dihydrophenyl)acetyl-CoA isomerase